jgi:HEAT repeat protein
MIAVILLGLSASALAQKPPVPPPPKPDVLPPVPDVHPMVELPPLPDFNLLLDLPTLPDMALFALEQGPKPGPGPGPVPKVVVGRPEGNEDRNYENGTRALDNGRWDEAVEYFNRVVTAGGGRADGAMYWIAWAQNKQRNGAAALEWLARLRKSYPESRWVTEARALEVEIRQAAGQPVRPENVPDEELRLMALNSLAQANEQRAIPMLEKIVNGTGSPRLKERALFVLAQNGSPEARQILMKIAKGGNPDLQARAVTHLGSFGGAESRLVLQDIYKTSSNLAVKRSILRSFMSTGNRERLLEVARTEQTPELRADAVQHLGAMGAQEQLSQLYATEKTIEVRRRIIQAMFARHNPDVLVQLLRTEMEPELRRSIVQNLGQMASAQGTSALLSLYASEKDESVRRAVIDAFANQRNVKILIELARKESDLGMKKRILERLAQTRSAEATDYFMEILGQP